MRIILIAAVAALGLSACGSSTDASTTNPDAIKVVAAENFWGSIAKQIGGDKVNAVSIISSPDTDPHDYDATAADSRTMAQAQVAIVNGIGYDPWAENLLAANQNNDRKVVDVGTVTNHKDGDNPHRWYSPGDVQLVVNAITNALTAADPKNTAYFDANKDKFDTEALAPYNNTIADIKGKYSGVAVGATESIFAPLAQDLGLDLVTPSGFMNAIAEGDDPTAADKTTADRQVDDKQIKVLVFNSQNATPDVQAMVNQAKAAQIPVVSVTETLTPPSATFQQWQTAQLQALQSALAGATAH